MNMLNRAHCLSSSPDWFAEECSNLKGIFLKLTYPDNLINSTVTRFNESRNQSQVGDVQASALVRIILPFKDQKSVDFVRRQLSDLGKKIKSNLRPVLTSKKIADDIKVAGAKPPLINQQCVVYKFKCDLCDADYIGYTCRHLFLRIEEQTLCYWKTPAWRPQSKEQRSSFYTVNPWAESSRATSRWTQRERGRRYTAIPKRHSRR